VLVALEDVHKTRVQHRNELESHAQARRIKEELIRQKNDKRMTEDYIDALYYYSFQLNRFLTAKRTFKSLPSLFVSSDRFLLAN
jgi:hypothetical protein